MPLGPRRLVALALVASLALPGAGSAQDPPPAPAGPSAVGSWEGWARLTNDWPGSACRYDGGPTSPSVRLELTLAEGLLRGSVAIDLAAETGTSCPPLRKRYGIAQATQGGGHGLLHRLGWKRVDAVPARA